MFIMTIGHEAQVAEKLRLKLSRSGLKLTSTSTLSLDSALHALPRLSVQPDLIFFRCHVGGTPDSEAIASIRAVTKADIITVDRLDHSLRALEYIRAGATDCLHDTELFAEDLQQVIGRVQQRTRGVPSQRGQIISVISTSGGCGASTIATNLSANFIRQKRTCGLVELNNNGGCLDAMLNLKSPHTLSDLMRQSHDLDQEMLDKSFTSHASGLRVLSSSPTDMQDDSADAATTELILGLSAGMFSHIVIDLDTLHQPDRFAAAAMSDMLLVVFRLEFVCLVRVKRMLSFLEQVGFARDKVRLVANRVGQKCEMKPNYASRAIKREIDCQLPNDYPSAVLANSVGNPLVMESPNSKLARAYDQLACTLELAPAASA